MKKKYNKNNWKSIKKNGKWLISDDEKADAFKKPYKPKFKQDFQFYPAKNPDQDHKKKYLTLYPTGVVVDSGRKYKHAIKTEKEEVPMRGKIKNFSTKSRRRMRMFMVTHEINPDLIECSVTLTVPGKTMSAAEKKNLWKYFTKEINRLEWACLWKLEIQERGQYHWHAIMGVRLNYGWLKENINNPEFTRRFNKNEKNYKFTKSKNPKTGKIRITNYTFQEWFIKEMITDLWKKILPEERAEQVNDFTVHLEMENNQLMWRRYMQDHASKTKLDQEAHDGKHWGIINRKYFNELLPDYNYEFINDKHFYTFRRAYNRLINGSKEKKRKLNRMRHGKAVYFSRPETVERLFTWSLNLELDKIEEEEKIPF